MSAHTINGCSSDYGWGLTEDGQGIVVWNGDWFEILDKGTDLCFTDKTVATDSLFNGDNGGGDNGGAGGTDAGAGSSTSGTFAINGNSADYGWGLTEDGQGIVVWKGDWFEVLSKGTDLCFTDQTVQTDDLFTTSPPPAPQPEPEPEPEHMNVVAKVTSADYTITEGETQAFSVTLDKPAAADTTLTVRVGEQTAFLADYGIKLFSGYILGDKQATFYFGSQADKDDALSRGPEIDKLMFDRYGMTREDLQKFPVGIENAVQDFRILDASGKEIQIGSDGTFTVDVKAGATTSEAFSVQALYDMQMTYSHSAPDAQEGAETFTFTVAGSNDTQCIESPSTQVTIENFALRHTPVALDLNGDGQINVTGASTSYEYAGEIGKTVQFDINGDGKADSIEWLDGSGDGLLVDNRDGNAAGDMNGGRLFGDQGGAFANGYEKLASLDTNGDHQLTGAELEGLSVWIDNGDALVQDGELRSVQDLGIKSIATNFDMVADGAGDRLMQSVATTADGQAILTEDVWFGSADGAALGDVYTLDTSVVADASHHIADDQQLQHVA